MATKKAAKKGAKKAAPAASQPTQPSAPPVAAAPAAPAPAAQATATPKQPSQNGVTRPRSGTATGRVWEIADSLSQAAGKPVPRGDVMKAGEAEGLNSATIATQYGRWRKFHNLGRYTAEVAEGEAAEVESDDVEEVEETDDEEYEEEEED
jgi:hypothetical protein